MNTQEASPAFVPPALQTPVSAAMKWLNANADKPFELTGIVDTEQALAAADGEPYQLGLVLCDGEICRCERVQFEPVGGEVRFSLAAAEPAAVPALLDPPPGLRRGWLDEQLGKFEFVLLLFYRGRW